MAISWTHYQLLKSLQPLLPQGGTLLEIGEANWYGDCEPDFPFEGDGFAAVKAMYQSLCAPSRVLSVDLNGTPQSSKFDLNQPIPLRGTYDIVINHGTAEHVFNIGQVFRTMHDKCKVGGLMIHEAPFTGWLDHGFYCLQPTLFFDLAAANSYRLVKMAIEEIRSRTIVELCGRTELYCMYESGQIPDNSMLFVAFAKIVDEPFRLPLQGYYNQSLSEEGERAWETCR